MAKRVTLKQVAESAGVSISAASTVLSALTNGISIPAVTQERIREAARTMGYEPRPPRADAGNVAFPERPTRTKLLHIGIITYFGAMYSKPQSDPNPWSHDIETALEAEIAWSGQARATFYNRNRTDGPQIEVVDAGRDLVRKGVDALVLIDQRPATNVEQYALDLETLGLPVVTICTSPLSVPASHVCYDNQVAGFMAAAHLFSLGHREITFLSPVSVDWSDSRIKGARDAARHYGFGEDVIRVFPQFRRPLEFGSSENPAPLAYDEALHAATAMLDANEAACAVIAANDCVALAFLDAVAERSNAPGEFAVIGFDDIPEARHRGLTTLSAPREAMGREAASLILLLCQDPKARKQICLQSNLIVRSSTVVYD